MKKNLKRNLPILLSLIFAMGCSSQEEEEPSPGLEYQSSKRRISSTKKVMKPAEMKFEAK